MRLKLITAAAMLLALAGYAWASAGEKVKPNYKVTRLSIQDVGVSCLNGQPPDVKRLRDTIIVSCDAQ